MKRRNNRKKAVRYLTAAVILTVGILMLLLRNGGNGDTVTVNIPQGSTTTQIAEILAEKGLIKSRLLFRFAVSRQDGYLKSGQYNIIAGTPTEKIIEILQDESASEKSVTLTIPEGFSVEQTAQRASQLGICSSEDFLKAADSVDYDFSFLKNKKRNADAKYALQGYLFPDTYFMNKDMNARDVVKILLAEFENKTKFLAVDNDLLDVLITKASLVQREATLESEMPIIAGVIENRIKAAMPLQIDAAVVYAVTGGAYNISAVSYDNLSINSPYNIYKNKGLPPGAICNPGLAAIKAAANPDRHDYLYYRTNEVKKDGSHIFTKTYDEHLNANK